MDWRNRKYYQVAFSYEATDMRVKILKNITGIRIHPSKNRLGHLPDEYYHRDSGYHYIVSVPTMHSDALEYELRKAERNDLACKWRELLPREYIKIETVTKDIIKFKKDAKKFAYEKGISTELAKCHMVNFEDIKMCTNCNNLEKCKSLNK